MAPLTVRLEHLAGMEGTDLGRTGFRALGQSQIDSFADLTDDHQWIHSDSEPARSGPFGGPIAQGFLTLALLTPLSEELLHVQGVGSRINYGLDRVRFTSAVAAGASIRLHAVIDEVAAVDGGVQVTTANEIELEGQERPALVARFIRRFLA